MTKLIVVIDDERTFDTDKPIIYLRTQITALGWFAKWWTDNENRPAQASPRIIDELWFDHDLGEGGDAMEIARFIFTLAWKRQTGDTDDDEFPIDKVMVHSQNPVGADNIASLLKRTLLYVRRVPLPDLLVNDDDKQARWEEMGEDR